MLKKDFSFQRQEHVSSVSTPLLPLALLISIPAFYLVLNGDLSPYRDTGRWLYAVVALLIFLELCTRYRKKLLVPKFRRLAAIDLLIFFGAIASALSYGPSWNFIEWLLRLTYCVIVFLRLSALLA